MATKRVSERQQYLNQEYARLRRNLLQRLRRCEKAGDKIDWTSVPRKPKRVTPASLRLFENGNVIKQRTGEYKFKRGYAYMATVKQDLEHKEYTKSVEQMIKENREQLDARLQAKASIGIEPDQPEVSPITVEYISEVKRLIEQLPDTIAFRSNANEWVERNNTQYKNFLLQLVDKAIEEEGEERMEWYYSQKINEITALCDVEAYSSDEDGVVTHDNELADLVYPSTVTYEMWEALY